MRRPFALTFIFLNILIPIFLVLLSTTAFGFDISERYIFFSDIESTTSEPIATSTPSPDSAEDSGLGGILSDVADWLIHLVIPSDGFYQEQLNKLDEQFKSKLPFQVYLDTIGRLKDISSSLDGDISAWDITYDYNGSQYTLEFSKYLSPYLPKIRGIITGLYAIIFAFYNYRQLMFMIRGTNFSNTQKE